MVIKCNHCKGLMRIDEQRIPAGGGVKVRCPHCSRMGYVPAANARMRRETQPVPGIETGSGTDVPIEPSVSATETPKGKKDPVLPDDAFREFRFPAEREVPQASRTSLPSKKRLLVWAIVSLAIVAFFALLVNLVLPGPSGTKPFGASVSTGQPRAPQPPPVR